MRLISVWLVQSIDRFTTGAHTVIGIHLPTAEEPNGRPVLLLLSLNPNRTDTTQASRPIHVPPHLLLLVIILLRGLSIPPSLVRPQRERQPALPCECRRLLLLLRDADERERDAALVGHGPRGQRHDRQLHCDQQQRQRQ